MQGKGGHTEDEEIEPLASRRAKAGGRPAIGRRRLVTGPAEPNGFGSGPAIRVRVGPSWEGPFQSSAARRSTGIESRETATQVCPWAELWA